MRGLADRAALKVRIVHAVHVGFVAACRTVAGGVLPPVLEEQALTVGLVRTVRIRPEQYLTRGELNLSARGGGSLVGHRCTPGAVVLQEAVVERAADVHAVGAGLCGPRYRADCRGACGLSAEMSSAV